MAWVIENTTLATTLMTAVRDAIDAGAAGGKVKIYNAADALLMTFTLATTSGTVSTGTLTFTTGGGISGSYVADGTADNATITDSDDNVCLSTTSVETSNADLVLSSLDITSGLTVTLISGAMQHG